MNDWKSAPVGSFRDKTPIFALSAPLCPLLLRSDDYPGKAEITGALWLCAHLSGQLFTPKDPQTRTAVVSTVVFFAGIPFPLNEAAGVHQSSPAPNCSCHRFFHKTELLLKNWQDQSKVAVLSHGFHFKLVFSEGDRQKPGGLIPMLVNLHSTKAALLFLLPNNSP